MTYELDCHRLKPALLDFALEEISTTDREELERHLKDCGFCSQELAELRRTVSLVHRAEASEEVPRKFRLVAQPAPGWAAFWLNPARLAFGAAGLFCVAIALLSLFRTNFSYENGNFQIAFGASAVSSGAPVGGGESAIPAAFPLDQAKVRQMISDALAAAEAEQQKRIQVMTKSVADQMQQSWQRDLREMAGSMRYFQAAQTMMWKEQVQNQQLVSALIQQSGSTAPARQ